MSFGGKRRWYEVRVRIKVGTHKWIKKSKFFFTTSSSAAASKYEGPGDIISSEKVSREKALRIREYSRLQGIELE